MRFAVISDIHSNFVALERVLDAAMKLGAERVYCLGDIVGYGSSPNECIDTVRERCVVVIRGNHDSGVLDETPLEHFNQFGRTAIRWTRKHITRKNLDYLRSLPLVATENSCTFAHATPFQPESWKYILNWADARECFGAFATPFCFIGHTHSPVIVGEDGKVNHFDKDCRHLINVGSVGQPRDGNPKACFAFVDTGERTCDIVRVDYDVEAAAAAVMKARLPDYLAQRLFLGV